MAGNWLDALGKKTRLLKDTAEDTYPTPGADRPLRQKAPGAAPKASRSDMATQDLRSIRDRFGQERKLSDAGAYTRRTIQKGERRD